MWLLWLVVGLFLIGAVYLGVLTYVRYTTKEAEYRRFPKWEALTVLSLFAFLLGLVFASWISSPRNLTTASTAAPTPILEPTAIPGAPSALTIEPFVPGAPGSWIVRFSGPIKCTGRWALAAGEQLSSDTNDCDGIPRTSLTFEFGEPLERGVIINRFARTEYATMTDEHGVPLPSYGFTPVYVGGP